LSSETGKPGCCRFTLVAEHELPHLRTLLAEEGWEPIELPGGDLDRETADARLDELAEHVAELRRNDAAVVVLDDGLEGDRLGAAFSGLRIGPLPRLTVPAEEAELREFLRRNAVNSSVGASSRREAT
jgi:hypothetical protein